MPNPRDSFTKIRTSMETAAKQALVPTRGRSDETGIVYARARLEHAEITESYFVEQELSSNPRTTIGKRPQGRIELAIPYDGCDYFTRQAVDDVARGIGARSQPETTAVIGHLLLKNYSRTSLRDSLHLPDNHDSVRIEIPVADDGLGAGGSNSDDLSYLSADRRTCITKYEFDPDSPDDPDASTLIPAQLAIRLFDPDSLDLPMDELDLRTPESRRRVIDKIRQQVSFRSNLVLHIVVQLSVPRPASDESPAAYGGGAPAPAAGLEPEVARMAIGWPTITSLRTLRLRVGDRLAVPGADVRYADAPVRYNPVNKCLEWEGVRMFPINRRGGGGGENMLSYQSAEMLLSIQHPGELYKQDTLEASAEVEIPGYLLSGLTARLFDATGHQYEDDRQPELTTRVCTRAELMLDDAFAKRDFSPYQHLFFDEIIPDDMRITDIVNALKDRGFEDPKIWPTDSALSHGNAPGSITWFLTARRQEGPDNMYLWIFVEGRRFDTERETTVLGGGVTHKTTLQSGELRVFVRGQLARDSKELMHEMNALQLALRERYERVRQRR